MQNLTWPPNNSGELVLPCTGLFRPRGFQGVKAPRFQDNQHMKVVGLLALCTDCLYPHKNIFGTHFC